MQWPHTATGTLTQGQQLQRGTDTPIQYWAHYAALADLVHVRPSHVNRRAYDSALRQHKAGTPATQQWFGCASADAVDALLTEGWPAGLARMHGMRERITAQCPYVRQAARRVRRRPQGTELDPHAVQRGDLMRAWRRVEKVERVSGMVRTKFVRIVLNVGARRTVPAPHLLYRPVAGLLVAEHLIARGYTVEVIAASFGLGVTKSGANMLITLHVSTSDRQVLPANFAILGLAGFFRKYVFAVRCAVPERIAAGFGRSAALATIPQTLAQEGGHTIITPDFWTEADAIEWINTVLTTGIVRKEA